MPRRLVIMRHGETVDNAAGIWQGHRDSPLSAVGLAQAERAAPVVAGLEPAVIVSSDLQRAAITADHVAAVTGQPVRRDVRLREVDVGDWGGCSGAEVRERDPELMAAMGRGEDVRRGRTGETIAELARRTRAALDEIIDGLDPGGLALVVCHGVTSRAGVASLLVLDQMLAGRILWGLDNCHWATVAEATRISGGDVTPTWRLDHWNVGVREAPGHPAPGS